MNGSKSPGPTTRSSAAGDARADAPGSTNGHASASSTGDKGGQASPVPSIEGKDGRLDDTNASGLADAPATTNGADEDAASEAETLIDSPVKRREAEKRQNALANASNGAPINTKSERAQKSRIGSLPVPQDDDEEMDSTASPMQSTEVSVGIAASSGDAKDEDADMLDDDADAEGSEVLSSAQPSTHGSPESSPSRAVSENPEASRKDESPPNPRKRKHRASSVDNLPSKRRSMDPPARRRLRGGMQSADNRNKAKRSPSPKARGHRRAVSTQSAADSGTTDGRKRRGSQFRSREPKSARGWEESDASSEATSRGNDDYKRPQRGVGRSTSTPGGRTAGREHKRHVNKYGFTKLAEACEDGDLDLVKEWSEKDPESLEVAEFAGNKPLQIAALNGNAEVVAYLIDAGAQTDCANVDKDTPLIDAAENGHLDVVRLLLNAGVDPLRQNNKGQQALDVVTDDTEEATGIRSALHAAIEDWTSKSAQERREEEEERHSRPPGVTSKELHFMARTYENLLKLVQNNDRTGVQEFLAARVPVDNIIIAAAAKTGDVYLVNMLLAEMTEKKLLQKAEKPMLAVLGSSHFEMVKVLTELEWFDPLWRDRQGKTWAELAEEKQGPMWRQEKDLLTGLFERAGGGKSRRSSSPVSKRDTGTRRKLAQQKAIEEGSDEDNNDAAGSSIAKKKPPRRLMSRKDLRTAKNGGATGSDDSEAASSEEDAPGEPDEVDMKPPETPSTTTRRHTRSKSQTGSPEVTPKSLRKKRSSSFRGSTSSAMPTLNEEIPDVPSGMAGVEETGDTVTVDGGRKDREEEAKVALELAKQAEEKRKVEEAAEAEAKKAVEEAERKAEEERRLEEERKAEERKAEEARKAEVARLAEEARKEEEDREKLRQAQEEEKSRYRSAVLAALPTAFQTPLHPETPALTVESTAAKTWLKQHLMPLRILPTRDQHHWILNLQAAPLLGATGLELFFSPDYLDYDNCRAAQWPTSDLTDSDSIEIERFLTQLPQHFHGEGPTSDREDLSFEEELKRTSERYNAYLETRHRLTSPDCKAKLRRVRLQDVVNNLHPALQNTRMEVEFAEPPMRRRDEVLKQLEIQGTQNFVGRMKVFWEGSRVARAIAAGQDFASVGAAAAQGGYVRLSEAVIRYEK